MARENGTFDPARLFLKLGHAEHLAAGDLDGDFQPELVIANSSLTGFGTGVEILTNLTLD